MRATKSIAWATLLLLTMAYSASGREWKDASGQHSREGEFVAIRSGLVIVRLANGNEVSAAWDRLSQEDRVYIYDLYDAHQKLAQPSPRADKRVPAQTVSFQTPTPTDVRIAQAMPTPSPLPAAPATPAAGAESAPADPKAKFDKEFSRYGLKLVFFAECGAFEIIGDPNVFPIIGTAHYRKRDYWPCCCCPCYGPRYLSFLRFNATLSNWPWLVADEVGGTSDIKHWAFRFTAGPCGHLILNSKDGTNWNSYGYAWLVQPK